MGTINTNCYGTTITFDDNNKAAASISSDMHDTKLSSEHPFNAAVDAMESFIQAQFCAGIDITSPAYYESIETTYGAICQQYDLDEDTTSDNHDDMVYIYKERNIQAQATENITYKVSADDWAEAMECNDDDEEQALLNLQRKLDVERVDYEAEVDECLE